MLWLAFALLRGAADLASASGGTLIPITFYTDNACTTPSTETSNTTIPLQECVVTPGLGSFELEPFPCASGDVSNFVFVDTACGQTSSAYFRGGDGHCFAAYSGDMAAIMLTCTDPYSDPPAPAGTATVNVGPFATPPSGAAPTAAVATAGAGGSSGTNTGTASSSSGSGPTGWDSLDYSSRIGIIVALSVGIPPILIALWALCGR